ncbi:hypothetical protein GGI07_005650 [Coemansia sp. Benny D115]|nr:hypothetical protein GGI07_005650 [Coemansia sp. Benny D115]
MDSQSVFSSPPRKPPSALMIREISRSGGPGNQNTGRRRDFRNLSKSSREGRQNEEPWRKRFREQCLDRLHNARDRSHTAHRQMTLAGEQYGGAGESGDEEEMSEEEMYRIVQQEWTRFKEEMERQSLEYGVLDGDIIEDLEEDLWQSRSQSSGAEQSEYAEWAAYEAQLLEEQMVDEELMAIDMDMDDI